MHALIDYIREQPQTPVRTAVTSVKLTQAAHDKIKHIGAQNGWSHSKVLRAIVDLGLAAVSE